MTIPEAIACVAASPNDDQPCGLNPRMTHHEAREMVKRWIHELRIAGREPDGIIAKRILQVMQDTSTEPVRTHFTYDSNGELFAGWNHQEADMIKWKEEQRAAASQHPAQATTIADINVSKHAHELRMVKQFVAMMDGDVRRQLLAGHVPSPKTPEPKPQTPAKPDLSSPTFVLKRPKRL